MLRIDTDIKVLKTKREIKLAEKLDNGECADFTGYRNAMLSLLSKLEEEYIPKYKYEQVIAYNEYINGIEIIGKKSSLLMDLLELIDFKEIGYGMRTILYAGLSIQVPESYIEDIKSIVDRLDRLYATTDCEFTETTDEEFLDLSIQRYKYEDKPYRKWLYYFLYTANIEGYVSLIQDKDDLWNDKYTLECDSNKLDVLFSRLPKYSGSNAIVLKGESVTTTIELNDTNLEMCEELCKLSKIYARNCNEQWLFSSIYDSLFSSSPTIDSNVTNWKISNLDCAKEKVIIGSEVWEVPVYMLVLILKDGDLVW